MEVCYFYLVKVCGFTWDVSKPLIFFIALFVNWMPLFPPIPFVQNLYYKCIDDIFSSFREQ